MQYPDWLMKAKESKKLLQWIQDPVHSFKMFHGRLLLKCQEEDCIVFYAVDSKEKDCLQLKEPKLCGVLYLPDYFLYEVDTAFYEAVGIPADFLFPTNGKWKKASIALSRYTGAYSPSYRRSGSDSSQIIST